MDRAEREAIAERILARSRADQTEILVSRSRSALTRFARGISNQNVAADDRTVSVRAIVDGKTGVAATTAVDDDSLDRLLARAMEMAALAPRDPGMQQLPSGVPSPAPAHAFVAATADADPSRRADIVEAIFDRTESAGYWCAGYAASAASGVTVVNSSGARASFDGTDASVNVKVTAADSTGFAECYAPDIAALDGGELGRIAVEKAQASARPRSIEPGEWTVILEPPAFGEFFGFLTGHFSAQSYDDGSSFFAGELGKKFFSDGLTISDDYANLAFAGMPFDFEGAPKQRIALVENGTVRNYVTDSYYAKKLGVANTGHALPAPNAFGPQALNITIAPGTSTPQELISNTKRGLLISRFWYIRTVDQKKAIVTGMTRDGTFLIEDGRIVAGVRNLRFNQSIVDALANITLANNAVRTAQYSFSLAVPTVKIDGFRFTSTTEF